MKKKLPASILFILVLIALVLFFYPAPQGNGPVEIKKEIELLSLSSAGDYGYASFNSNSNTSVNLLALKEKPITKVYFLDRQEGIGINHLGQFSSLMQNLENYGIEVEQLSNLAAINADSFIIIPQGAMPEFILSSLDQDLKVLYIGKTDALLSDGVVLNDWYGPMDEEKKNKIILYNLSLDEAYGLKMENKIFEDVLFQKWALEFNQSKIAKQGLQTIAIPLYDAKYLRLFYLVNESYLYFDSQELEKTNRTISLDSAFPLEDRSFYLNLEEAKGIPRLLVYKDAGKISEEKLGTSGQDLFFKSLSFESPGIYIIRIQDYTGEIASGILHVKNLEAQYLGQRDYLYDFYLTIDSAPISGENAKVWLEGSNDSMEFSIYSGKISVPAKLKKGQNIFVIEVSGQQLKIPIRESTTNIFEIYLTYGPLILVFIAGLYFFIILTRKQPYRIKVDSSINLICGEVKSDKKKVRSIIPKSIAEFGNNGCIDPKEFSLAIRKYITDDFDVLDGNAEAILKGFEKEGYLESYKSFYTIKGKYDVKTIVMNRFIKEKLIEHGIHFSFEKGMFKTSNFFVMFGTKMPENLPKKLFVIFESSAKAYKYHLSLDQKERAKLALRIRNGSIALLGLEELDDYL